MTTAVTDTAAIMSDLRRSAKMKIFQIDGPLHHATLSCMIMSGIPDENRYRDLFKPTEGEQGAFDYHLEKQDVAWIVSILKRQTEERSIFSTHGIEITQIFDLWQRIDREVFSEK